MSRPRDLNPYQLALMKAKNCVGSYHQLASYLGVSGRAVNKWWQNGRPPRTEYTGETQYAQIISKACSGEVDAELLLPALPPKTRHDN